MAGAYMAIAMDEFNQANALGRKLQVLGRKLQALGRNLQGLVRKLQGLGNKLQGLGGVTRSRKEIISSW